jgi:hypothetical protein
MEPKEQFCHPSCFLTQSAETLEKKRVEFFVGAKKCKGVRKNLKGKGIRPTIV